MNRQILSKCFKCLGRVFFALPWEKVAQKRQYYQRIAAVVMLIGIMLFLCLERLRVITLEGEALGMPYRIQYYDYWVRNHQKEIDELLKEITKTFDTTLAASELSRFNAHGCTDFEITSPLLYPLFSTAKAIYEQTEGSFDPTASMLGAHKHPNFDCVVANEQRLKRLQEGVVITFQEVLQGYAVDQIVNLLNHYGDSRIAISLGSMIRIQYRPNIRPPFPISIHKLFPERPKDHERIFLAMRNEALAVRQAPDASREAVEVSKESRTLYTVVVAPNGTQADAYATAFLTCSLEKAKAILNSQQDLLALIIYEVDGKKAFFASPGLHAVQQGTDILLSLIPPEKQ